WADAHHLVIKYPDQNKPGRQFPHFEDITIGDIILDVPNVRAHTGATFRRYVMASSVVSALHFHDETAAFAFVEARVWPNGPICPHCGCYERVGRLNGKSTRF